MRIANARALKAASALDVSVVHLDGLKQEPGSFHDEGKAGFGANWVLLGWNPSGGVERTGFK